MLKHVLACILVASPFVTGAARAADAPWEARFGITATEFDKANKGLTEDGYRLAQIVAIPTGKDVRFTALWEKGAKDDPAREARHNLTSKEYEKLADELKEKGFRPVDIRGYEANGESRFAAIWEKAPKDAPERRAAHALASDEFRKLYTELNNNGFRPLLVSGYAVGKETRYATIWEKAPKGATWHARRDLTAEQYQEVFNEQGKAGLRIIHVSGYTVDGAERFACVWAKTAGPTWYSHHAMDAKQYESRVADYKSKGFRPLQVSGYAVDGKPRFAGIWVRE